MRQRFKILIRIRTHGRAYTKRNITVLPLWQPLAYIGIELQGFRIWTEVRL